MPFLLSTNSVKAHKGEKNVFHNKIITDNIRCSLKIQLKMVERHKPAKLPHESTNRTLYLARNFTKC